MTITGLSGSLLSQDVLLREFAADRESAAQGQSDARRRLHARQVRALLELGPATGARTVFDRVAAPLARDLGFTTPAAGGDTTLWSSVLARGRAPVAALLTTAWEFDPAAAWRDAVKHAIGLGLRWSVCANGPHVRIFDARRTWSRRYAQFDLLAAAEDERLFRILWGLLSPAAFPTGSPAALERALALSERHRTLVRNALQAGVEDALRGLVAAFGSAARWRRRATPASYDPTQAAFDESLIVIYRILFLLFAEARGLVPQWHPTYRDSYTIASLQPAIDRLVRPRGLWESLQAIARLAHRGCGAGALRVPPFNGRLFSPSHAPLADGVVLDDETVRKALAALTTRKGASGPERIAYAELGVEQLGGVYERVLDYEPSAAPRGPVVLVPSLGRKATGTFYTPRSLTEYVVRRTLAPLVRDAAPDRILEVKVLDPAMGSGAFLVAACRYLASKYEAALVREGVMGPSDVSAADRAGFRRLVAQRCLYGVDLNPMAVQLARLSLWLATLSGDRPLTFLDHHLRTGNSLAGASLEDLARAPTPRRGTGQGAHLPLFDWESADAAVRSAIAPRVSLAVDPGDTLEQVRAKERLLASIGEAGTPLDAWRTVADLWCTPWFAAASDARALRTAFPSLMDRALGRHDALPDRVAVPLVERARDVARRERFFHWKIEFPEVFVAAESVGVRGFDAVLCNPPWETLRADGGDERARRAAAERSKGLTGFTRTSGVYRLQRDGHANLYQLFVERALSLVRRGGRAGLVLPSSFATDHGCAGLRRHLLDRSSIDTFTVLENKEALFPIHRSLKFLLLTATADADTQAVPLRCGVRSPDNLDRLPDEGADPDAVVVDRSLLDRLSGDQLAIPEFRDRRDLEIVAKIAFAVPALGDAAGWNVRFGRELNASDDRGYFVERSSRPAGRSLMPVVEGKQIRPFGVSVHDTRYRIPVRAARRLLDPERTYRRARLAYRDVSCATNRLTLIAAIVPRGTATTHTLFCLKPGLDDEAQQILCGLLNSYVANYLVRLRVSTHVTTAIVHALPVPRLPAADAAFTRIGALARALAARPDDAESAAELQALAARLYGLDEGEFQHILATFPLVDEKEREGALRLYRVIG